MRPAIGLLLLFLVFGCAPSTVKPLDGFRLSGWSCPPAGLILRAENSNGGQETHVSNGPDPENPEICRWTRGQRHAREYFSYISVESNSTSEEREGFLTAMRSFMNGQAETVGFTTRRDNQQLNQIMRIIGRETLDVGGTKVETIKISVHVIFSGTGSYWEFDRWLDPERHLWLKTYDPTARSEWRVVAVDAPPPDQVSADVRPPSNAP